MAEKKKLVVVVTNGFNDERSSVAWSVANGAIGSDMQVTMFLVSSGVDWVRRGAAEKARPNPLDPPMKDMIQTVLDSRIEDAARNLEFIDEFENSCDCDWPAGVSFTLGFGRTMLHAMKTYVEENRHMFDSKETTTKKVAAR